MEMNCNGYLESLKNTSISSMNDFNRVSHISGGLLFRCYRRSTFVTCQIIFPGMSCSFVKRAFFSVAYCFMSSEIIFGAIQVIWIIYLYGKIIENQKLNKQRIK